MTMAESGRETAFSMRWNALKAKAENATKELAASIQEQRDKFVESRVTAKAQADKAAALNASQAPSSSIDNEQHEEALRIVQYQNKALRDRLRSTAAENERLHEMLKEYRCRRDGDDPSDHVSSLSTVPQLEQQIQLLRENVTAAEEVAAKKEAHYLEEIERLKTEAEASRGELESALGEHRARLEETTRAKQALEEALERERAAFEQERNSMAELSSLEKSAHEGQGNGENEQGREELAQLGQRVEQQEREAGRLRAIVKDLTEERDIARADVEKYEKYGKEAAVNLMKAQKEVELLQGLLEGAKAAEREASEEARRHSGANAELTTELESLKSSLETLVKERNALREQVEELHAKDQTKASDQAATSDATASHAAELENLQKELDLVREKQGITERALEKNKAAMDELHAALEQARSAADESTAALADHAREEAQWTSEKSQLNSLISKLNGQIDALAAKEADAARLGASQLEHVKQLEARVSSQATQIDELAAAKAALVQELATQAPETSLEEAATQANAEVETLKADLETLKTKLAAAEKATRDAQEHKRQTASKLDQLQSMIASGAKSVEEMRRMQTQLAEKDEEIQRLTDEIDAQRARLTASPSAPPPDSPPAPPSYDTIMNADDLAAKVQRLEKELHELQRSQQRNDKDIDVDYLAAVLRQSFACGELDAKSPIFGVISRLLHFTDSEIEDVLKHAAEKEAESAISLQSLGTGLSKSLSFVR